MQSRRPRPGGQAKRRLATNPAHQDGGPPDRRRQAEAWTAPGRRFPRPWLWLLAAVAGAVFGLGFGEPEPGLSCDSCGGSSIGVKFLSAFTNDDEVVNNTSLDPKDNGIDPGYDKRVAVCQAWVTSSGKVRVEVRNGYPSYTCRFWTKVRNIGESTIYYTGSAIDAPAVLTVRDVTGSSCSKLKAGGDKALAFTVHVEQAAHQQAVYSFEIEPRFKGSSCGW